MVKEDGERTLSSIKRALIAKQSRERGDATDLLQEPIAVIGIGCRFPGGADSPEAYWRLLRDGVDAVSEIPPERWDVDEWFDPDPEAKGRMTTRWGAFVDDIDCFDAGFFRVSPREAKTMDPQHRMLLECAWEALERAGYATDDLMGSATGIFVGQSNIDYVKLVMDDGVDNFDAYVGTGNSSSVAAGRIAYFLGTQGPAATVDTACSSSLVTVHLACQSLRTGECALAIAGGTNAILIPATTVFFSKLGAMAPDGRCKAFDARANGYVRGEGAGVVVLKRLSDALAEGDPIEAIVRGTAVNQDGRSAALVAPNPNAQRDVIRAAIANAGISPCDVTYVEAHGTGTVLGDPIEIEALAEVLGEDRPGAPRCRVGSVKTNFGHLESAAGVAGLIKVILSLKHRTIPPHLHFETLSPSIELSGTRLSVPTEATPWDPGERPRFAGVSSFGFSGTNAHTVLEEAPRADASPEAEPAGPVLLPISAKTNGALRALAGRYADWLQTGDGPVLRDVAHTAARRRRHMAHRAAFVGETRESLRARLRAFADEETSESVASGRVVPGARHRLAFVFSGQGSQWWGMGRELLATEPTFREATLRCDEALADLAGWSPLAAMADASWKPRLYETDVAQPVIFALQVALAELWRAWGLEPDTVVGHSVGEIAAAHVAGALDLESAARIVVTRSRLIQTTAGRGCTYFVELPAERAEQELSAYAASVAAVNGPRSTVVSGDPTALETLAKGWAERGVFHRLAKGINVAAHSEHMDALKPELRAALDTLVPRDTQIDFVSTVTGGPMAGSALDAEYWCRNMREPVRFDRAVDTLLEAGINAFLEIGGHPVLRAPIQDAIGHRQRAAVAVSSLRRETAERRSLLESVGQLYAFDHPIDWARIQRDGVPLAEAPTYPWQRERFWIGGDAPRRRSTRVGHPLLGEGFASSVRPGERVFELDLAPSDLPWLEDHRVDGAVLLPATAFLEMALAAATAVFDGAPARVADLRLARALVLPDDEARIVQLSLAPEGLGCFRFQVASRSSAAADDTVWLVHATGALERVEGSPAADATGAPDAIEARCTPGPAAEDLYAAFDAVGFGYGPSFRGVVETFTGAGESAVRVRAPDAVGADAAAYGFHPALLDACLHAIALAVGQGEGASLCLPVAVESYRLYGRPGRELTSHVRLRDAVGDTLHADVTIESEGGERVAELRGIVLRALAPAAAIGAPGDEWLLRLAWSQRPLEEASHESRRHWLVFGEEASSAAEVAEALEREGQRVTRASPGSCFELLQAARLRVAQNDSHSWDQLFAALTKSADGAEPLDGIVYFDASADSGEPGDAEEAVARCAGVLGLVQALSSADWREPPRLWLVTRGAQHVTGVDTDADPAAASLWGLARVIAMEHAELRCTRIDVSRGPGKLAESEVRALTDELLASEREEQIALRRATRYVGRLSRAQLPGREGDVVRIGVAGADRAVLAGANGVSLTCQRRAPGAGEVAIDVEASARTPGTSSLRAEAVTICGCVGHVAAVGAGVEHLCVGQRVVAWTEGAAASFVTLTAWRVARCSSTSPAPQLAATLYALLPAWQAVVDEARVRAGDAVAIVGATTPVVEMARSLAQSAGARVLDADADELEVLDVLFVSDGAPTPPLAACAVVSLGSGDASDPRLVRQAMRRPERFLRLLGDVADAVGRGEPAPPGYRCVRPDGRPVDVASEEVARAGERSADVEVVCFGVDRVRVLAPRERDSRFDPTGTCLVTGGLGGLGLSLARWLVAQGVRSLALVGRSQPGDEARRTLAELEREGANILVARADVGRREDVAGLLRQIDAQLPPLRSVFHLAGTIDDGLLIHQDVERLGVVMRPKLGGALHLDELCADFDLEHFVLFSSAAGLLGSPGQANYAAASAALGALAQRRTGRGLAATCIDWGVFGGVGRAAREQIGGHLASLGIAPLQADEAWDVLGRLLDRATLPVGVVPLDVRQFLEFVPSAATSPTLEWLQRGATEAPENEAVREFRDQIAAASPDERRDLLEVFLRQQIADVIDSDVSRLDGLTPLEGLGIDSIMGLELRNRLERGTGLELSATLLWTYPHISGLARGLAARLGGEETCPDWAADGESDGEADDGGPAALHALSDQELLDALAAEVSAAAEGGDDRHGDWTDNGS